MGSLLVEQAALGWPQRSHSGGREQRPVCFARTCVDSLAVFPAQGGWCKILLGILYRCPLIQVLALAQESTVHQSWRYGI